MNEATRTTGKKSTAKRGGKGARSTAKKPSERMKKAALLMMGNGGNKAAALREAGYSPAIVDNPQKITEGPTWKALMDEYLPEEKLAQMHARLFDTKTYQSFMVPKDIDADGIADIKEALEWAGCKFRSIQHTEKGTYCFYYAPDTGAMDRALEKAYKLRGLYPSEGKGAGLIIPIQVNVQNDRSGYSS